MSHKTKPAISGGEPIREHFLPYGRQWLDNDDIKVVKEVLEGDYLTTGPAIERFEKEIAEYTGAGYAVAFANGTAALHGACFAAGIKEGDEVITTPITFAASANCVLYQGGTPIFADVNLKTYNIEPQAVEKLVTKKTKAIIPVDFTGQPVDLDAIKAIAKEYDLITIEDAAHALGARYKGKRIGGLSDMSVFSFHPVKQITTGEGGIVTTNNESYCHKLKQFRIHGITREPDELICYHGPWYYEMQEMGFNYRMTDIQAALGISQLKKLENFIKIRQNYAKAYSNAFRDMEEIICPIQLPDTVSGWHLYVIRLKPETLTTGRREIFDALQKENIGVQVHYIPVYYHPYYQKLGYSKGLCPNAEKIYEEILTLPLFPAMNMQDLKDVIHAVKKVVSYYKA